MLQNPDEYIWCGEKVRLRTFEPEDWAVVLTWDFDSENQRLSDRLYFPRSAGAQRRSVEEASDVVPEGDVFRFAVEDRRGELVGTINTHSCNRRNGTFKYGLGIGKEHRRRGYATEAIALVLRYYFGELRYQKATVHVYDFNVASLRLHEKAGFVREGQLRSMVYTAGLFHDEVIFGMTVDEWRESPIYLGG